MKHRSLNHLSYTEIAARIGEVAQSSESASVLIASEAELQNHVQGAVQAAVREVLIAFLREIEQERKKPTA
jgi:hypothetical protein